MVFSQRAFRLFPTFQKDDGVSSIADESRIFGKRLAYWKVAVMRKFSRVVNNMPLVAKHGCHRIEARIVELRVTGHWPAEIDCHFVQGSHSGFPSSSVSVQERTLLSG
ncbi:hypothetical protein D3C80_1956250 [compost metagenome]